MRTGVALSLNELMTCRPCWHHQERLKVSFIYKDVGKTAHYTSTKVKILIDIVNFDRLQTIVNRIRFTTLPYAGWEVSMHVRVNEINTYSLHFILYNVL